MPMTMHTCKTFEEKCLDARNKLSFIFPSAADKKGDTYRSVAKSLRDIEKLYKKAKRDKVNLRIFENFEENFALIDSLFIRCCEQFGYNPVALSIVLQMKK